MVRTGVCLSVVLCSLPAAAAQVVVTEVTYTHSGTTTTDSHLRVNPLPGTPANWVTPVDYSHGTAVVRLEVFTKPTTVGTKFQICFEATPNYACTNQSPTYTAPGLYEWTTSFPSFYQYSLVDWAQGTRKVALILKDTMNNKPSPDNVPADVAAMYMPTDLRVTVTLVSPGGTYVPPAPTDAGTPDAGVDAGTGNVDAGPPDSGTVEEPDAGLPLVDAGAGGGGGSGGGAGSSGTAGGAGGAPHEQRLIGGCSSGSASGALSLVALLMLARRGSRARRAQH